MSGFHFDTSFFLHEIGVAISYIPVVLLLALIPVTVGLILGLIIAIVRVLRIRFLSTILKVVVIVIRGIPIVLILMISYLLVSLGFDQLVGALGLKISANDISYTFIAIVGLSLSATAYLSEALRSALESVNIGQYEAARSVGMSAGQMFRRIVIPQAVPVAIPLVGNNLIGIIKGTSVASLISVVEMVAGTLLEATQSYKFLEAYVAAAVVYWGLCFSVERLTAIVEARVKKY